ncbi:helix-turn-helix domain-containing protein [Streptomyces sp. KL116D]|uniref:helix-turn-helix domain-containing protein n=1 Tax=Streptomyces sp. KL116D TaxID=3045152 RepID=UPI003558FE85
MSTSEPWRPRHWHNTTADDFEVELVVAERQPATGLTKLEQRMVTRQLRRQDVPGTEIARIVGVDPRTVWRWLAEDRKAAA